MLDQKIINKILLITLLVILFICEGVQAQNITNPLLSYKIKQDKLISNEVDSVISTKLYFDNLPEYGKESKVIVEHYASFSTKNNLLVKAMGKSILERELILNQYSFLFPGPINKGDTLIAEFYLKPIKVGEMKFHFLIFENDLSNDSNKPVAVSGYINSVINIATNGKTQYLALNIESKSNDMAIEIPEIFGPEKNLFSRGLYFSRNPIIRKPIYENDIEQIEKGKYRMFAFSTYYKIIPAENDKNLFHINCRLNSFYDFEKGMGFDVSCTDELEILNISESINDKIEKNKDYLFSFDLKVKSPGISFFKINFSTPNTGKYNNFDRIKSYRDNISDGLVLYIGTDSNNEVQFIVDKHPAALFNYSNGQLENRRKLVESYDLNKKMNKFIGEYYNEIFSKKNIENK